MSWNAASPPTLTGWMLAAARLLVCCTQRGWQQDIRTAVGRGEEVGSCKQGGQEKCLKDALRCNTSQSTTSLNSQPGRTACWEKTRNIVFLSKWKSGSGSESKKQSSQRRLGLLYAESSSSDQIKSLFLCGPLEGSPGTPQHIVLDVFCSKAKEVVSESFQSIQTLPSMFTLYIPQITCKVLMVRSPQALEQIYQYLGMTKSKLKGGNHIKKLWQRKITAMEPKSWL